MKTAISIPDDMFETVNKLARELRVPRSQIFTEAVNDYIKKLQNRKILNAINRAYAEAERPQEAQVREKAKTYYRKRLKIEKW